MKDLVKISLKYGVIAGLLGAGLLIGLYYMGRHPLLIPVYADARIILFGIFMFFTLKEYRDHYHEGILYFWQGIFGCFVFTVMFALTTSASLMVLSWAEPRFVSDYITLSVAQLRTLPPEVVGRIGKEVYDYNLKMLPETNKWDLGYLYFWQSLGISLFLTIILSVILRRHDKP